MYTGPRHALVRQLCADIPANVTVLAYNMSFEKGVLRALAEEYEDLREHLLAIADNLRDLMTPFQQKHYVTPAMLGSYVLTPPSYPKWHKPTKPSTASTTVAKR